MIADKKERKGIYVRMDGSLRRQVKMLAAITERSMSEVIENATKGYMEQPYIQKILEDWNIDNITKPAS